MRAHFYIMKRTTKRKEKNGHKNPLLHILLHRIAGILLIRFHLRLSRASPDDLCRLVFCMRKEFARKINSSKEYEKKGDPKC